MAIVRLADITHPQANQYGGKAASLAKMLAAGFDVPAGFVVDVNSYLDVSPEFEGQVLQAFDDLGAEHVAVRSSAIAEDGAEAAWAGQLDTYLNVTRPTLIHDIQRCWTSLRSDRAEAYAEANNVDLKQQKVAVIVQAMVQSDVAGVAFSTHPVTLDDEVVVIEAGYGLGEAVVAGQITPDNYVVNKVSLEITEKHISNQTKELVKIGDRTGWQTLHQGKQQKLTDEQIKQLTTCVIKLEEEWDRPVDVEWMLCKGKLFPNQCRPITTLT